MICATLRLVWALVFALGFWGALGGLDWPFLFRLDVLVLLDYCGSPGAKWRVWRAVEFFMSCLWFSFLDFRLDARSSDAVCMYDMVCSAEPVAVSIIAPSLILSRESTWEDRPSSRAGRLVY